MLVRVLTLRFDTILGGFDDAPLRDFLKDKDVLALHDHFFVKDTLPYLTVVVTYTLRPSGAPVAVVTPANAARREDTSWRSWVSEADVPLFNTLRDWRSQRSKQEGVPPYIICTNRQFAAMVQARPQSLAALGEIEGVGKAKLDKYGAMLLALLAPTTHESVFETARVVAEEEPADAPIP